jgi:FemAB family
MQVEELSAIEALNQGRVMVDQLSEREWNELLPVFGDASIYQTWAYGAAHWGEKNLSHLIVRREGRVVAMAQFRILRLRLLKRGIAYARWGPLCRSAEPAADRKNLTATMRAIKEEYAARRRLLVSILPGVFERDREGEVLCEVLRETGFSARTGCRPQRTIRLDLTPSLEALRKGLDPKWRNKLNGAGRNGLSIVEGTGDELYAAFAQAYREMLARKKFEEGISVDSFARVQRRLPESLKMRILLCQKGGKTLNGVVVAVTGDTAIYLLGATTDEGTKAKGSYLLQWRAIEWLKERGVLWYDLGGVDPERNPGGYDFKKGFGGEDVCRVGEYRFSASAVSSAAVSGAERLRNALRFIRARLRK